MMTKTDKLIFWGVLLLSVLMLLFSNIIFAKEGIKKAVIEVNGEPYASYTLENLQEEKHLLIETEYGKNEIEISRKGITVLSSDCSDGLCTGNASHVGEMLICLPHRLVCRIEGDGEVDHVAY